MTNLCDHRLLDIKFNILYVTSRWHRCDFFFSLPIVAFAVPPSFVDVPLDQTVRENDETSFYCSATGNPTPTITWLLDGMTVASGKTFKFVANRTQSGQYWCSVENGLNVRINASAQLDVQCKLKNMVFADRFPTCIYLTWTSLLRIRNSPNTRVCIGI